MDNDAVQRCYDVVAGTYAAQMGDELAHKPFDRQQLDRLAARAAGQGTVVDAGCGPGQVARYLRSRGAGVLGVDLSHGMLREARRLSLEIPFQQHNLLRMGIPDGTLTGVAAFYAIVHFDLEQVACLARELARTLMPGGCALLAFHVRFASEPVFQREHYVAEFLGHPASATFTFFQPEEVAERLSRAGLVVRESLTRPPYPDVEAQTHRAYVWAHRPG